MTLKALFMSLTGTTKSHSVAGEASLVESLIEKEESSNSVTMSPSKSITSESSLDKALREAKERYQAELAKFAALKKQMTELEKKVAVGVDNHAHELNTLRVQFKQSATDLVALKNALDNTQVKVAERMQSDFRGKTRP